MHDITKALSWLIGMKLSSSARRDFPRVKGSFHQRYPFKNFRDRQYLQQREDNLKRDHYDHSFKFFIKRIIKINFTNTLFYIIMFLGNNQVS